MRMMVRMVKMVMMIKVVVMKMDGNNDGGDADEEGCQGLTGRL